MVDPSLQLQLRVIRGCGRKTIDLLLWTFTFNFAWTIHSFLVYIIDANHPIAPSSCFDIPILVAFANLLVMHSETIPFLSATSAHLLAGLFAFTYVGSIYASKSARLRLSKRKVDLPEGQARLKLQNERWRDDPDVIKARLLAVSSATVICCLIVSFVMKNGNGDNANVGYDHLL